MRSKSIRWWGVLTLFAVVAISYIDRINIAVLITDSSFLQHFGMEAQDRSAQGALATAFMLGYGVSSFLLTPFCTAFLGVRRSLVCGLLVWGAISFLSPWLSSYGMLLTSRVLLGVAEGPLLALASAYIKAHFDTAENGKPNSLVNMGTGFGLAIGYPLVGYLVAGLDWENSFQVVGLLNLVLGIPLVLAFVRMPANDIGSTAQASNGGAGGRVGDIVSGALRTRYLLTITLLTAAMLSYLWGSSNWLPAYLKEARGFSLKEMGWLASLPQYALMLGMLLSGFLIDRIRREKRSLIFVGASACVAAFVLLAISARNPYLATAGLIAANLCCGLLAPLIPSTVQAYSRPEHIASAFGVVNGIGSLAAGFMPALMGAVISAVSASGGKTAGFFAGFALLICSQLVVLACGVRLWLGERAQGSPDVELEGSSSCNRVG
ncbi:putative L-galactonate transporter [compost metagenome]